MSVQPGRYFEDLSRGARGRVVVLHTFVSRALSCNGGVLEGAFEAARRAIRASNRGAEAVARWNTLLSETDKGIKTVAPSIKGSLPENTGGAG